MADSGLNVASRTAELIERSRFLDRLSGPLNRVVHKIPISDKVQGALSGTWLGHPVHPFLVATPIGCWTSASLLDLLGGRRRAAQTLVGAGVASAVPTALTGAADWSDTTGAEQRVGFVHLSLNLVATGCYTASWLARRRARHARGVAWALAGAGLASAAGWLGGHLAYALGVGVDTNAFEGGPAEWTEIDGDPPAEGALSAGAVGGVGLLLARHGGELAVLANRCSHRGGPLSDGELDRGCVTCPWHGSRFDLANGEVRRGPAVVPQPTYQVRAVSGQVEVRRDEPRSLRQRRPSGPMRAGSATRRHHVDRADG
ncbi:MAG TPA: Rieske (2Fe-2S) protein [Acidimicrobiales bacterium]|jgi:nitrite reductase/ring-hydroxylating ferredoxin subunit/uncharacterized membrane protein|nr:Rieske (2Fe-2S) protein [Acidimicrobiales bacterium]